MRDFRSFFNQLIAMLVARVYNKVWIAFAEYVLQLDQFLCVFFIREKSLA